MSKRPRLPHRLLAALLVLAPIGLGAPAPAPAAVSPQRAAQLFARFAGLAGEWREQSTRGWTGRISFRVIAAGSVVMASSAFDDPAAAANAMVTMISRDGDRLLLTHYCEAGNQPRLAATAVSDDGSTVTFTFLDAGNLPDRNAGHMDQVVIHFVDRDHFTERWTWYQDGHERWLEEIGHERVEASPSAR